MARSSVQVKGIAGLLLAPVVGGLFVVCLPFIGLGMILRAAFREGTDVARDGARDLAATVAPGWRPGEAHMTGRAMDPKRDDLPAGGAGEKALADVTAEVARQRGGEKDGER
jgi:hypothetical protein